MSTDTSPMTWAYVVSALSFAAGFIGLLAGTVWTLDRISRRRLRRHIDRALDREIPYLPLERSLRRHPAARPGQRQERAR